MDDDRTRLPDEGPKSSLLSPGQAFGQYKVIRLLGRGGMGEVYEVENPVLEKRYALKLLNKEIMQRPDAAERFKREAKVMARFDHPNIVKVDDFGEIERHAVLRMELVEGGKRKEENGNLKEFNSLSALLTGEPLPEALVIDLLKQILDGLSYAHEQGVVHRDLKPSNILLQSNSSQPTVSALCAKITDFGLVRLAGEQWVQSQVQLTVARSMVQPDDPDATRLDSGSNGSTGTSTQALLGTFEFMSPEQRKGQEATAQSDLYSVGLIAFRMLTGQEQPGLDLPSELVEGLNPAWDRWIKRAIAQDMHRRWKDADAMHAALPWSESEGDAVVADQSAEKEEAETDPIAESAVEVPPPFGADEVPESDAPSGTAPEEIPPEAGVPPSPARRGFGSWVAALLALLCVGALGYFFVSKPGSPVRPEGVSPVQGQPLSKQQVAPIAPKVDQLGPESGRDWTVDLGGGERMQLKWIAAGSFQMGSNDGDSDEKPVHRVNLSKGYWLGEHEVTIGEWREYVKSTSYRTEAERGDGMYVWDGSSWKKKTGSSWRNVFADNDENPVVGISWNDAVKFCEWLTGRERAAGRLPAGLSYTLPTEAQWEYACRAGTAGAYAGDLDAMGWYGKNSGGKTHPVGQKRANAWGLYDMHGNVWEWCLDWYGDYPSGSVVDPRGASSGAYRVLRGGSWGFTALYCRSAVRYGYAPGVTWGGLGFRLALSSVP